jgi:energy-converting hydrogenase Eha subunit C
MINLSSTGNSLAVAKRNYLDPAANTSLKLRPVTLLTIKAWFIKLDALRKQMQNMKAINTVLYLFRNII